MKTIFLSIFFFVTIGLFVVSANTPRHAVIGQLIDTNSTLDSGSEHESENTPDRGQVPQEQEPSPSIESQSQQDSTSDLTDSPAVIVPPVTDPEMTITPPTVDPDMTVNPEHLPDHPGRESK